MAIFSNRIYEQRIFQPNQIYDSIKHLVSKLNLDAIQYEISGCWKESSGTSFGPLSSSDLKSIVEINERPKKVCFNFSIVPEVESKSFRNAVELRRSGDSLEIVQILTEIDWIEKIYGIIEISLGLTLSEISERKGKTIGSIFQIDINEVEKNEISSFGIDSLLENKHEYFGFQHFLKEKPLDVWNEDHFEEEVYPERVTGPAEPIVIDGYRILLPKWRQDNSKMNIKRYFLSTDGLALIAFIEDSDINCYFLAICRKVGSRRLYVATIYHELYSQKEISNGGQFDGFVNLQ